MKRNTTKPAAKTVRTARETAIRAAIAPDRLPGVLAARTDMAIVHGLICRVEPRTTLAALTDTEISELYCAVLYGMRLGDEPREPLRIF